MHVYKVLIVPDVEKKLRLAALILMSQSCTAKKIKRDRNPKLTPKIDHTIA